MSHSASGLPTDFFMFTFPSSFHLSTVSPSIRVANWIIYVNLTTLASSILPLGTLNIFLFTLTFLFSFRVANSFFFSFYLTTVSSSFRVASAKKFFFVDFFTPNTIKHINFSKKDQTLSPSVHPSIIKFIPM